MQSSTAKPMRAAMQAVQSQASEAGQDLELAQALWQLGCVLSDQARWADALAPLRQSLLLMESLEHSDTLDIACVCNGISTDTLTRHCFDSAALSNCPASQESTGQLLFAPALSALGACLDFGMHVAC